MGFLLLKMTLVSLLTSNWSFPHLAGKTVVRECNFRHIFAINTYPPIFISQYRSSGVPWQSGQHIGFLYSTLNSQVDYHLFETRLKFDLNHVQLDISMILEAGPQLINTLCLSKFFMVGMHCCLFNFKLLSDFSTLSKLIFLIFLLVLANRKLMSESTYRSLEPT